MIKATFPEGVTAMTVNGLHQWDYGQTLQIQATGLPALVEVHFACDGMNEAVVRSCSVTNGTLTAAIPDICLEQTSPVMAWVYIVGGSSGITTLTITLPIIARARPQPNATIPEDTSDKYTEAVAAMNTAINNLSTGNFTAARAIADGDGRNIPNTYALKTDVNGELLETDIIAKAEEIVSLGGCLIKQVSINGDKYEKDSEGNPINLPHEMCKYSRATIMTFFGGAVVYLWGFSGRPTYYRRMAGNGTWSDWITIIDSENIGNHAADGLKLAGAKSATISNGVGALATGAGLERGAFYLVEFSGRSGTIYRTSDSTNVSSLGEYYLMVNNGGDQSNEIQIWRTKNDTIESVSGTIRFYKMGTVS